MQASIILLKDNSKEVDFLRGTDEELREVSETVSVFRSKQGVC